MIAMAAARGPQDAAFGRPAPGWATQAVLAARRAAISRAGLQLSVRCDGAYVSLHAEAPIAEGDVIFREHPAVAAPSVLLEDEGGGAGLQTCEYCFAPVGSMAEQLQAVAAAAGLTLSAEQLELVDADGVRAAHKGVYRLLFTNGVDAQASIDVTVE